MSDPIPKVTIKQVPADGSPRRQAAPPTSSLVRIWLPQAQRLPARLTSSGQRRPQPPSPPR